MKDSQSKTKLAEHQLTGKKLIPPLASLKMTPSSWVNDRLPEMLWAALFTEMFPREEVLERFGAIVDIACKVTDTRQSDWRNKPLAITLSGISSLKDQQKQQVMLAIAKDYDARQALVPMLFFEKLPDKKLWESVIKLKASKEDWNKLAKGIAGCFFHQSQKATDCRWVKALYMVKSGFVIFTKNVRDTPKFIIDYPSHEEEQLRLSRPSVRSMEISLAIKDEAHDWPELFWKECYKKTGCIPNKISEEEMKSRYPSHEQLAGDKKKLGEINQGLSDHFWNTTNGSDLDPKHEVVFGLALFASDLAASSILLGMGRSSQARMVLRCMVECLISLKYLKLNDKTNLWSTFKSHGMGQAKLVIQRAEEENRVPKYLDQKNLGQIANDDVWVEFLPVDIGSWDDSDLRKRATSVGLKARYDDYFTWPSSYSHGQWGAIREAVYDLCGNPLHRFHRIPLLYSLNLQEAREDIFILLDDIVNLLYEIYPKKISKK